MIQSQWDVNPIQFFRDFRHWRAEKSPGRQHSRDGPPGHSLLAGSVRFFRDFRHRRAENSPGRQHSRDGPPGHSLLAGSVRFFRDFRHWRAEKSYPLTAPSMMPWVKKRWTKGYTISIGSMDRVMLAAFTFSGVIWVVEPSSAEMAMDSIICFSVICTV